MVSSTDPKGRSNLLISRKLPTFKRSNFDVGCMPFSSFAHNSLPCLVASKQCNSLNMKLVYVTKHIL